MACFLIPAGEAVVTTVAAKIIRDREASGKVDGNAPAAAIPFSAKLGWLNKMLWGGSALLAFEHLWHGEISPYFPFLTAVQNGQTGEMLAEMGTNGVLMALLVTAVWAGLAAGSTVLEKNPSAILAPAGEGGAR